VVRSLSAISSHNVPHSSRRMATNALRSRVGIKLSIRALLIILPWRLVFLIPPIGVFDVEKKVTCLTIVLRSPTSRLPRGRVVTRSLHLTLEGWTTCLKKQQWRNRKLCLVRSMSIPLLPLFFLILEHHILSYHKHLLEYIEFICVPWRTLY
jgi:hypothetical protein